MFLGVDGGGTKTELCLMDGQGTVICTLQAPGCYYFSTGLEGMEKILREGVEDICKRACIGVNRIEYAFFGLPTYGESTRDVAVLDDIPERIMSHRRYRCDNDMVCGWAGSLGAMDGINVIAGTGSMTYGEKLGRRARCGGWGELFGDEGSAYWIAIQGLAVFSKMSDGRIPKSMLHAKLKTELQLSSELDIIDIVLNRWHGDRAKIAALSKLIVEAAGQGDEYAREILHQATRELAELVDATRRALGFDDGEEIPVSYSGGVFSAGSAFVESFRTELARLRAGYSLRRPLFSPAVGAAMYAAKLNKTPIDIALVSGRPSESRPIQ